MPALKFVDGLDTAYNAIHQNNMTGLKTTHDGFIERLAATRLQDENFHRYISSAARKLCAPLVNEDVDVEVQKNGQTIKARFSIGERVARFKKFMEKETLTLKNLWSQWEEIQNEYIVLGIEVFGEEAFGDNIPPGDPLQGGFKTQMELLSAEHDSRLAELSDEISNISNSATKKMKLAENVSVVYNVSNSH